MRTAALVTTIALALGAAACAGGDEPETAADAGRRSVQAPRPSDSFATRAELRWLERVADWSAAFSRAGGRVAAFESDPTYFDAVLEGDEEAIGAYREVLAPVRDCGRSFRRDVGAAPTARLRPAALDYVQSCAHFRRGVDLLLRAIGERNDELADTARAQIEAAGKEASRASGTLPPGEKQELPLARGAGGQSRVDPLYGRAASAVAEKPVEVRCWSKGDWKRLLVEEKVFTRGRVDERVLGFASAGGSRVSLSPRVCGHLDALAYDGVRARDQATRFAHAVALVVLTHEARHAAGIVDEPTAECEGMQLAGFAARRAGIAAPHAASLVRTYWRSYPALPAEYRSPECRDGGMLDLDLDRGGAGFP